MQDDEQQQEGEEQGSGSDSGSDSGSEGGTVVIPASLYMFLDQKKDQGTDPRELLSDVGIDSSGIPSTTDREELWHLVLQVYAQMFGEWVPVPLPPPIKPIPPQRKKKEKKRKKSKKRKKQKRKENKKKCWGKGSKNRRRA